MRPLLRTHTRERRIGPVFRPFTPRSATGSIGRPVRIGWDVHESENVPLRRVGSTLPLPAPTALARNRRIDAIGARAMPSSIRKPGGRRRLRVRLLGCSALVFAMLVPVIAYAVHGMQC